MVLRRYESASNLHCLLHPSACRHFDALEHHPARFRPPVRSGFACAGQVGSRVYTFGGSLLRFDNPEDATVSEPVAASSAAGGFCNTNKVYGYNIDTGLWYVVEPRNGLKDASPPSILDLTQTVSELHAMDGDDSAPSLPPAGRPSRRRSVSERRTSVSASSFMAALSIHVPAPRSASAAAASWGKIAVFVPAAASLQAHMQVRVKRGEETWQAVHGLGTAVPPSNNLLAVTATLLETCTSTVFWVHGGQGGRHQPLIPPTDTTTAAVLQPQSVAHDVPSADATTRSIQPAAQADHSQASLAPDLPVSTDAASIGNTHGFQLHGANSLASLLSHHNGAEGGHRRGSADAGVRPLSHAASATKSLATASTPDLTNITSAASTQMLSRMLRGGGNSTVTYELFDDLFAFDTETHTWRVIDTTANALQSAAASGTSVGTIGVGNSSSPTSSNPSRPSSPSESRGRSKGAAGTSDAFARPRPRRGHSLASYVVCVPKEDTGVHASGHKAVHASLLAGCSGPGWTEVPRLALFGGSGFLQGRGDVSFGDLWVVENARPGCETYRLIHTDGRVADGSTAASGGLRYGYGSASGSADAAIFEGEYSLGVDVGGSDSGGGAALHSTSETLTRTATTAAAGILVGGLSRKDAIASSSTKQLPVANTTASSSTGTSGKPPASRMRPVPPARSYHACTIVANGMYIYGGCNDWGMLRDLWRLDLLTYTWARMGPYPPASEEKRKGEREHRQSRPSTAFSTGAGIGTATGAGTPSLSSSLHTTPQYIPSSTSTTSASKAQGWVWPPPLYGGVLCPDPDPEYALSR